MFWSETDLLQATLHKSVQQWKVHCYSVLLLVILCFTLRGATVLPVTDIECEACFWPSCLHKTHKPTLHTYTHTPWSCVPGWYHSYES